MKIRAPLIIFVACQICFGAGEVSIITMSEWSKPVSLRNEMSHDIDIRGRLLVIKGIEPAYGGPNPENGAMTFVELQNVTRVASDIELYFAVTNLQCELTDAKGKAVPIPGGGWGGRGPWLPCWVRLPYNSTLRLFINGGRMEPLTVYPGGEPGRYWSIPKTDTNVYYLGGTLDISTHANASEPPELWDRYYRATIVFPKQKITPEGAQKKR